MPWFGLDKMRLPSQSARTPERKEQYRGSMRAMTCTPSEPPPPYTESADDSQPTNFPDVVSPTVPKAVSTPYQQTHQPPEYQPGPDIGPSQIAARTTAAPSYPNCTLAQALGQAAREGKSDVVRALLEAGAEPYESSPGGTISALHEALRGPVPALALLVLDYARERADHQGGFSSADGTSAGEERVKFLLRAQDATGCTPLHLAASAGAAGVVRRLLDLGAAVDATDMLGRTPLHLAARYAQVDAVDALLEYGADAELVHETLWTMAAPETQRKLGDYLFVKNCVAKGMRKRQGQGGKSGGFVGNGDGDGDFYPKEELIRANHKSPTGDNESPPLGRSGYSTSASAGSSSTSMVPRSVRGIGPAAATPDFPSPWRQRPRQPGRRPADSLMFSPQYAEWTRMCETVQEEHRRQKQRNLMSGSGESGLL